MFDTVKVNQQATSTKPLKQRLSNGLQYSVASSWMSELMLCHNKMTLVLNSKQIVHINNPITSFKPPVANELCLSS